MALLVLPLLAFVAAHDSALLDDGNSKNPHQQLESRRAVNGTEMVLECPAASHLVRTHMAPDFEHPQLVRRLDWIHDGTLVASFHQDTGSDINQQWWVSSGRFELLRPFFGLRIGPVLPQDTGQWRCRLATDPLFALELPQHWNGIQLLVLVKPPVPHKPVVQRHSDHSVTLEWSKFAPSPAHQPILRYSILVMQPAAAGEDAIGAGGGGDGSMRVLTTESNQTQIEVSGLRPNTKYAFSVRAENAVGESQFGQETLFRTVGLPPQKAPEIRSLRNGTTANCVDVEWDLPGADKEPTPIVGFRIMVHRLVTGAMREWYVKGGRIRSQLLCSLEPNADYVLTMEADNGFGYSAGTTAPFRTDQSIPDGPPDMVQCHPLHGGTSISLNWRLPLVPNGPIRAFFIYFKEVPSQRAPGQIRLNIGHGESSPKAFAFNLTKLAPNTRYKVRLSAATDKGEGPKSEPILVDTDFAAPQEAPKMSALSFGCDNSLLTMEWTGPSGIPPAAEGIFRISVHSSMASEARIFNISSTSPHKLLMDQVQLGERLSVSITLLLKSRVNSSLLLPSPQSELAYFALISNGWRCRFRSSACPPPESLSPSSICEFFPEAAAAQQGASLLGQQQATASSNANGGNAKMVIDANMPFIFLIFGAAIALAISLLFVCMLRKHCPILKRIMASRKHSQRQQDKKGNAHKRRAPNGSTDPESVSLVRKANGGSKQKQQQECSVILPPITMVNNGQCQFDGITKGSDEHEGKGGGEEAAGNCCELNEPGLRTGPIVNVLDFDAHFEAMAANGCAGFKRQFQEIEMEMALQLKEEDEEEEEAGGKQEGEVPDQQNVNVNGGQHYENNKNRYVDIMAVPKRSRIRLVKEGKGGGAGRHHQYINANYVDSCDQRKAYIATQAPLPHTYGDFWAMVWQERCQVLVALTNMVESGRRKCDQYWPEHVGTRLEADQFLVQLKTERTNSVFTHRIVELSRRQQKRTSNMDSEEDGNGNRETANGDSSSRATRTVHQLHFMGWPDHGVPDNPFLLLHFINYVADLHQSTSNAAPCVVHCSAGVGRSGAFILIDSLRRHLLRCDRIDVCGQLRRMRRQRAQLVQTLEQFVFCNEVIRHLVANGISRQPRSHFPNYCQFLFSKCTPAGQLRIQSQFDDLLCCPHGAPGCSPSANSCTFLPGFHRPEEFLFCGVPNNEARLPEQFWQAIWESKCQSLAILDSRTTAATMRNADELLNELLPPSFPVILLNQQGEKISLDRIDSGRILIERMENNNLKDGGDEHQLPVSIQRICTATLLANPWAEIERLQTLWQDQHRGRLALIEVCSPCRKRRPTAAPFIFCTLQSIACQLEQEGAVDVLLWLASYRHIICGCWTDLAEIEKIYRSVLELLEMQRAIC